MAVVDFANECVWIFYYPPVAERLLHVKYSGEVYFNHEMDRMRRFISSLTASFFTLLSLDRAPPLR